MLAGNAPGCDAFPPRPGPVADEATQPPSPAPGTMSRPTQRDRPDPRPRLSPGRLWLFRVTALLGGPALFLVLLELALRLLGVGSPTSFLVDDPRGDGLIPNERFGWRFFPPALARTPVAQAIAVPKPPDTFRIVILGGSAALGTPDDAFGMGRFLEILLQDRSPRMRIEVVNAAMTAINSHVVRVIADELPRMEPDAVIVYLGNNEVVGPHGAGTVFAGFGENLTLIRLGDWLGSTRLGQVVKSTSARMARRDGAGRWGGMQMFLQNVVPADDPRLDTVYDHFRTNLRDVAEACRRADAPLLLSTVVTNLRDTAPLASVPGPDVPSSRTEAAAARFAEGEAHRAEGRGRPAFDAYQAALALDPAQANPHFRLGQLRALAGDSTLALERFVRARDLDALRFRADTAINAVIREVGSGAGEGVTLVDAEAAFLRSGIPGDDLLFEHVHLTPEGNYRVARLLAAELLPRVPDARPGELPDLDAAATRLGLSAWAMSRMLETILGTTSRPPFTNQLDHAATVARRHRALDAINAAARSSEGLAEARDAVERALAARPGDVWLLEKRAEVLTDMEALDEAEAAWRTLADRFPRKVDWQERHASVLAASARTGEALAAYTRILEVNPYYGAIHAAAGRLHVRAGRTQAALDAFERALSLTPEDESTRLDRIDLWIDAGRHEDAEAELQAMRTANPANADVEHTLARLRVAAGDHEGAIEILGRGIAVSPGHAGLRSMRAMLLAEAGRLAGAEADLQALVDENPTDVRALNNLATLLSRQGRRDEARALYERALAIDPDYEEAKRNLERLPAGQQDF